MEMKGSIVSVSVQTKHIDRKGLGLDFRLPHEPQSPRLDPHTHTLTGQRASLYTHTGLLVLAPYLLEAPATLRPLAQALSARGDSLRPATSAVVTCWESVDGEKEEEIH